MGASSSLKETGSQQAGTSKVPGDLHAQLQGGDTHSHLAHRKPVFADWLQVIRWWVALKPEADALPGCAKQGSEYSGVLEAHFCPQ